jgi:hypothetical protein
MVGQNGETETTSHRGSGDTSRAISHRRRRSVQPLQVAGTAMDRCAERSLAQRSLDPCTATRASGRIDRAPMTSSFRSCAARSVLTPANCAAKSLPRPSSTVAPEAESTPARTFRASSSLSTPAATYGSHKLCRSRAIAGFGVPGPSRRIRSSPTRWRSSRKIPAIAAPANAPLIAHSVSHACLGAAPRLPNPRRATRPCRRLRLTSCPLPASILTWPSQRYDRAWAILPCPSRRQPYGCRSGQGVVGRGGDHVARL